jgi:arylsulfatase A
VSRFKGRDVAGAKLLSTDAGTHVPLIIKWPGVVKAGSTNENLIDFTDYMPTILDAANYQAPTTLKLDGLSFFTQLKGEKGRSRTWTYSWYLNPQKKEPRVYARNHQYKLYDTGEFYDVSNDQLEQHPISVETSTDLRVVHSELQKVIADYSVRRLDAIKQ